MNRFFKNLWRNKGLVFMTLPGIILLVMFNYVPMAGIIVAFKRYSYTDGIFGSPWCGLDNFIFLFKSADTTWRLIRNTVGYFLLFTMLGTVANVTLAIMINECRSKYFIKTAQTMMIMPAFISYIAVTFIVVTMLDPKNGPVNKLLLQAGIINTPINWYMSPQYWPFILPIIVIWKGTGYGSILYVAALTGMDPQLFEAADLDGATKWQQIRYITLPMLASMVSILLLMSLGGIMSSDTGLFYQVTKNVGMLYPTTQTIDAYVLNSMMSGKQNFSLTGAVSFFQSVVGCVMVVVVNLIVRKIEPENSLF